MRSQGFSHVPILRTMIEQNRQDTVPEEGLEAALGAGLYGQPARPALSIADRHVCRSLAAIVNGGAK